MTCTRLEVIDEYRPRFLKGSGFMVAFSKSSELKRRGLAINSLIEHQPQGYDSAPYTFIYLPDSLEITIINPSLSFLL